MGWSVVRRPERERRRLQDRASSWGGLGHLGGVGRPWGAPRGAAGCGGGGGDVPHSPWICRVGVLRRVKWMRRRCWQVIRFRWLSGWLSLWGVGLGGPLGVDVVAGRIQFLVGWVAVPGGRRGSEVERLVGLAAVPCGGAVRS